MSAGNRIFLLSPANAAGRRAQMLLRDAATFDLAVRLRETGAPIGEVFAFISGLYFRGKLAYARAFARESYVIFSGRGLVSPDLIVTLDDLRAAAEVPIDAAEPRYREPLERDAIRIAQSAGHIILLGSIATSKYMEPLVQIFGERLLFPAEFAGRGDMSRGGLMLRAAQAGVELTYVPAVTGPRHGPRPPKLERLSSK